MPSVGPGRGGKPLTGVDGPMDGWMETIERTLCDVSPPRGARGYAGVGGGTYCLPP